MSERLITTETCNTHGVNAHMLFNTGRSACLACVGQEVAQWGSIVAMFEQSVESARTPSESLETIMAWVEDVAHTLAMDPNEVLARILVVAGKRRGETVFCVIEAFKQRDRQLFYLPNHSSLFFCVS